VFPVKAFKLVSSTYYFFLHLMFTAVFYVVVLQQHL